MKKLLYLIGSAGLGLLTLSTPTHTNAARRWEPAVERRTYELANFTGIILSVPAYVQVEQGSTFSVQGETSQQGLLDYLSVSVEKGDLRIQLRHSYRRLPRLNRYPVLRFRVKLPSIERLTTLSSGDITVTTPISSPQLSVRSTGSGDIQLDDATCRGNFTAQLASSGNLSVGDLEAETLNLSQTGSGDIRLSQTSVKQNATIRVLSAGDCTTGKLVTGRLEYYAAGSGNTRLMQVESQSLAKITLLSSDRNEHRACLAQTPERGQPAYRDAYLHRTIYHTAGQRRYRAWASTATGRPAGHYAKRRMPHHNGHHRGASAANQAGRERGYNHRIPEYAAGSMHGAKLWHFPDNGF